ncbi:MAG: hypothetical protein AMXMBFR4_28280 [Candidatus Hydrogenedentota bacterium]
MPPAKKGPDSDRQAQFMAELERERALRQKTYREQALKLFPHVCARCGREFAGKRLRELTVHHKDHNHMNNPGDGSNWELLCLYCHDEEHREHPVSGHYGSATMERHSDAPLEFRPFAGLQDLLKPDRGEDNSP